MLVFYVDKRGRMIVFMNVVAALARVVAEVNQKGWAKESDQRRASSLQSYRKRG